MYCFKCGNKVDSDQNFCTSCGTKLQEETPYHDEEQIRENDTYNVHSNVKETFLNATERVNRMVGEEGRLDVNLKDVFSSVFKKHTKDEAELLFISGTKATTPNELEISASWPKPWLFMRTFLVLGLTFLFLLICTSIFESVNALPGLIIVGSFAAPFSLLILFWEMNAPRNISIYEVAKMLFVGGAASLVVTLIMYSIFPAYDLDVTGAIIVGIVEEVGKFAIIVYFTTKLNPKFILNGLLIGATIGAGFAAFESAGYAFRYNSDFGESAMISLIITRSWMSIGTHVVWSAIAGAALVYVKGNRKLINEHIFNSEFMKLFSVSIILHAIWDMPLYALQNFYFLYIVLIVVAWIFIFSLINAGLKQITRLNEI